MISPRNKKNSSTDESICRKALPLSDCLAKTYTDDTDNKLAGRSVFSHCQIVGEIAREIIARLPNWLRHELFSNGMELIAAAHDIGKISPKFQKKIYHALGLDKTVLAQYENTL